MRLVQYLLAMGILLLATGLAMGIHGLGLSEANIIMTILMGVAVSAFWLGLGPAILASVAGVLLFNFFFTEPYHSLDVRDPGYLYTFVVMLATALGVSMLAHRVRHQAQAARQTQRRTESLYQLSRRLVAAAGMADLVVAAQRQIGEVFDGEALVLLPDETNNVGVRFGGVPKFVLASHELAAAQWVYEHAQPAGRGTETLPTVEGFHLPLLSQDGPVGVLALRLRGQRDRLPSDQRQLLETFAAQLAISIQRERLHEQARLIQIEMETERTRSNLLSSVSHDLRTPLAVIAGTSSSLLDSSAHFDEHTRRELIGTIHEESARLSKLVENLLYMTRLESGATRVRKEWQLLDEAIGSAIARVRQSSPDADLQTSIPMDLPQVPIDGVLIEQVLINLIDNAIRHGGPSGKIEIQATAGRSEVVVQVLDQGPGIPPGQERHIFEKFVRAGPSGANNRGAGLGLAICDAIIRAHGGNIEAFNRPERGACLRFTLPIEGTPPPIDDVPFRSGGESSDRQDV
jgi:two-component system sensor histidine kinase KdpD